MGLSGLTPWQWSGAIVSALLVGLSKAGFGTGAGILAVPLMAAVLGPANMLSVMLLVLITGDVFTLVHYVRKHEMRVLAMLVPGLVLGVGAGYLALDWFLGLPEGEVWMKRIIGSVSIAFVGIQFVRMTQERRLGEEAPPYRPRAWQGVALGSCAGLTSTLAHAGGPLVALFLLPQKLDKQVFVGTMVKYFFIGNVIKLVPYFAKGLMTAQNALLSLALLPAVAAGTVLGVYCHGKFSDSAFRVTVYVLALLAGLYLLVDWEPGRTARPTEAPGAPAEPASGPEAYRQGEAAFARSDWRAGAAAFQEAASRPGPWQERANFNVAFAFYRMGEWGRAGGLFADLSRSEPGLLAPAAMLNAGNCAFRSGLWGRAAAWYAQALGASGRRLAAPARLPAATSEMLQEVRDRAEFNLTIAFRNAAGAGAGRGDDAGATGAQEWPKVPGDGLSPEAAVAASSRLSGAGTGYAGGAGEGRRGLAAVLAYVAARDTGPVMAGRSAPPPVDGKGW